MLKHGAIVAGTLLVSACVWSGAETGPLEHEHTVINLERPQLTRVRLMMGSGELEVNGGATSLADADFLYNVPAWKPDVAYHPGALTISHPSGSLGFRGNTKNHWRIGLNDGVPVEVVARLGAGEARLTLGSLDLRRVELNLGAGEADVDLRGTPKTSYSVSLHGGVGEARVHLPSHVAISANASGGIGSINVRGLEKRNGRWINARADDSPVLIELDIHGGIGEISIDAQ